MQKGALIAGRFEIEALAGSGGMADVYLALDHSSGDRVALKLLRAAAPDDLARLAREAQALGRLSHPNIVTYVAHGAAEGGEPFVAMQWVEGETLSRRLRQRGPLALGDALMLGRTVAAALAHAHEHGIVHRDVKPTNIILRNGELEDPVLLDFGVARTGLAVGLTQLGTIIGTPRYMAPEQARGGLAIDARADVFALGALMFKCFTGRAPFDGDDAIAVLAHLLFDDAPDVCTLVPSVPRAVGDVLLKMLAKEPADRYLDGAAVVRAIDALGALDLPNAIASPAPSGLTLRERRLLSLLVLTGKVDAAIARSVANDFGGRAESLANGSVVVVVSGRDNASELARVSARCALQLRQALPEAPIVLATGRGDDTREDATETIASEDQSHSGAGSRYTGVFERAAGLLRHESNIHESSLPIMIDDTTAGLLGADFDVTRGSGSSVHALRGHALVGQYTLLGKPTPFVGRTRELSSLLATWDDVCEQSVARVVLVTGEAGLGKSRLLFEMFEGLKTREQPVLRLRAKADATNAGSPFAALGAALRRELGISDEEPPEERWHKLAARITSVIADGETHVAEFVAEVAGLRLTHPGEQVIAARRDPRLMGDRIRRSWRAWIKGEATRGPVLIVLDDFHWGDLPTVKLFDDMLHDLVEEPIFVLALARPEIDEVFPNVWSRVVERMPLSSLSKKAAATFARSMLANAVREPAIDRIVTLASGNALHLEELVRATAEGKNDAPESLLAMLSAQIELLPDAERRLLRAASVFGSTFWAHGVCVLLGGTQEPSTRALAETNTLVDSLARREMVSAHSDSILPAQRELEFRNALVRDVTYQMLTDDDRRLGHALAADWLERAGCFDPFVLAKHRELAGQLDRAVAEFIRSAAIALDASDFGMVLDRVARAKACNPNAAALVDLLMMEAEAHRWRGETRECGAAAKRASELAAPQSGTYFRALQLYGYASSFSGEMDTLLQVATTLCDANPRDEALGDWAVAIGQVSNALVATGHLKEHEALLQRLEQVPAERLEADIASRDAIRTGRGLRALARGDFLTMVETHRMSATQRRALGDERGYIIQLSNVAFALMWLGRLEEALASYDTARSSAIELKLVTLELNAIQNASFVRLCLGDLEGAIRGSRDVLVRAEVEAPRSMALAHLCIARALLEQGAIGEAEREARAGIATAPTAVINMYSSAVLADVLLHARRLDEARVASDEALFVLRTIATLAVGDLFALIVRAEILEATNDLDNARQAIEEAWHMFLSRRAFLANDTECVAFDTYNPDAARLARTRARLVERD